FHDLACGDLIDDRRRQFPDDSHRSHLLDCPTQVLYNVIFRSESSLRGTTTTPTGAWLAQDRLRSITGSGRPGDRWGLVGGLAPGGLLADLVFLDLAIECPLADSQEPGRFFTVAAAELEGLGDVVFLDVLQRLPDQAIDAGVSIALAAGGRMLK